MDRQMEIVNNVVRIVLNPIAHMQEITNCDFSLLYNLLGEPFIMDHVVEGKVIKEVIRDSQWLKTFSEVLKRSTSILKIEHKKRFDITFKDEAEKRKMKLLESAINSPVTDLVVVAESPVIDSSKSVPLLTETTVPETPDTEMPYTEMPDTEMTDNDFPAQDFSENDTPENDYPVTDLPVSHSPVADSSIPIGKWSYPCRYDVIRYVLFSSFIVRH